MPVGFWLVPAAGLILILAAWRLLPPLLDWWSDRRRLAALFGAVMAGAGCAAVIWTVMAAAAGNLAVESLPAAAVGYLLVMTVGAAAWLGLLGVAIGWESRVGRDRRG